MNLGSLTDERSCTFSLGTKLIYFISAGNRRRKCAVSWRSRFEIKTIFLKPEGKLAVLDVNSSDRRAFSLVVVYAPIGAE